MIAAFLGLWLALLVAGDTPVGRGMRHWLVDRPAAWLNRLSRGTVLTWLMLGLGGMFLFWMLEGEGLRLFAMALPELAGWVTAFEITTLVDAIAATALAASTVRIGALRGWIAARMPRRRPSASRRRARRTRRPVRADNDDDAGAIAAAA